MRFDPDKHRAHQTFESACLERYRTRSGASARRRAETPVAVVARYEVDTLATPTSPATEVMTEYLASAKRSD